VEGEVKGRDRCIREQVLRLEASGPVARVVMSSCITISAVC
jgi:hypothetical protein